MNIKLLRLSGENFKCHKSFLANFSGESAVVTGANGTGKTTIYDMFLWLLFGKDSYGRKDYEIQPLDANNKAINGLITCVEADIDFDGTVHTLKKTNRANIVKKQIRGYTTECWIDEVPKLVSQYAEYVFSIISEDSFKLLTDLHYFNEKMHWTNRRNTLLNIAGEIGTPAGFNELMDKLNGRSIAEYKSVLMEQKKRHTKDREEINPRIDEIQRGLDSYAGATDTADLEVQRATLTVDIKGLEADRQKIVDAESDRQQKVENINRLKARRMQRESELLNDTSGIKHLLDEKAQIESGVADKKRAVATLKSDRYSQEGLLKAKQQTLDICMKNLQSIRDENTRESAVQFTPSSAAAATTCYACKQPVPEQVRECLRAKEKAEFESNKATKLKLIAERGKMAMQARDAAKTDLMAIENTIIEINKAIEKAEIELSDAQSYMAERFAQIDPLVKSNTSRSPQSDDFWVKLDAEIHRAEAELGPPASGQIKNIEMERGLKMEALAKCNMALAQVDRMKKDKERIIELEAKERELAQQLANVDKLLADIDLYNAAQSELITDSVNVKFKHVKFKLFKEQMNGGYDDTCEVMLGGRPYGALSCGERIFVGIDVINTLCRHYGISTPVFIDNAESFTMPNELECQHIDLKADINVHKLTIITKEMETVS